MIRLSAALRAIYQEGDRGALAAAAVPEISETRLRAGQQEH